MHPLKNLALVFSVMLALMPVVPVRADVTYLATAMETLYRITPERDIESWEMGVMLRAMHRDLSTGTIYVLGDSGASSPATVYVLNNPVTGTPTLTEYTNLTGQYGSLTAIGEDFYAFSSGDLYRLDLSNPGAPVESFVGSTGLAYTSGAAYDPGGDALYMLSNATDVLYTVDPSDATPTEIGALGIDAAGLGAEWFQDQLFVAAQNETSDAFEIGTADVVSGLYSPLITVLDGSSAMATALTVVPEPTSLGLLLVGALAFSRRR